MYYALTGDNKTLVLPCKGHINPGFYAQHEEFSVCIPAVPRTLQSGPRN